jgi:hypothetical protein
MPAASSQIHNQRPSMGDGPRGSEESWNGKGTATRILGIGGEHLGGNAPPIAGLPGCFGRCPHQIPRLGRHRRVSIGLILGLLLYVLHVHTERGRYLSTDLPRCVCYPKYLSRRSHHGVLALPWRCLICFVSHKISFNTMCSRGSTSRPGQSHTPARSRVSTSRTFHYL